MNRIAIFTLLGVVSALPCVAQANQTDSQTLLAILAEMRGMHNDVRVSQTTQILLTELVLQQTALTRARERRDDSRAKVLQAQNNQKGIAAQIAQFQTKAEASTNPVEKKQLADVLENYKPMLVNMKTEEMDRSNELREAEASLRTEQDKLDGIQSQLDDVVKRLQPANSR